MDAQVISSGCDVCILEFGIAAASFGLLRQTTGLSPGALFLGLLLGQDNWSMRQAEFYGEVTVGLRN